MCLKVKNGCEPTIASGDIAVYKIVTHCNMSQYESAYRCTREHYNKCVEARDDSVNEFPVIGKLKVRDAANGREIHAGLHAYLEHGRAMIALSMVGMVGLRGFGLRVCRAVIPKGAEYCLGDDGDIVATRMIVFNTENEYTEYTKTAM